MLNDEMILVKDQLQRNTVELKTLVNLMELVLRTL